MNPDAVFSLVNLTGYKIKGANASVGGVLVFLFGFFGLDVETKPLKGGYLRNPIATYKTFIPLSFS